MELGLARLPQMTFRCVVVSLAPRLREEMSQNISTKSTPSRQVYSRGSFQMPPSKTCGFWRSHFLAATCSAHEQLWKLVRHFEKNTPSMRRLIPLAYSMCTVNMKPQPGSKTDSYQRFKKPAASPKDLWLISSITLVQELETKNTHSMTSTLLLSVPLLAGVRVLSAFPGEPGLPALHGQALCRPEVCSAGNSLPFTAL